MVPATVYLLCGLTSLICAILLYRSYRSTRNQLTYWTALAFSFFTLNNFMVVADFVVYRSVDLSLVRTLPLFVGVAVLVFGLVWESV